MSKEAMKLALEALKQIDEAMPFPVAKLAQSALRKALASEAIEQPAQQEPVAWMQNTTAGLYVIDHYDEWHCIPLHTSPPAQRTWVGLTDCEREKLRSEADEADAGYRKLIKATEAKLREKNV